MAGDVDVAFDVLMLLLLLPVVLLALLQVMALLLLHLASRPWLIVELSGCLCAPLLLTLLLPPPACMLLPELPTL